MLLRRLEFDWVEEVWPQKGTWPVYALAWPTLEMDKAVFSSWELVTQIRQWDEAPPNYEILDNPDLHGLGGLLSNQTLRALAKKGLASKLIEDCLWPDQPSIKPFIHMIHFDLVNGSHNSKRGTWICIYPAPLGESREEQKQLDYYQLSEVFSRMKNQTQMPPHWRVDLPIADTVLHPGGYIYIMACDIPHRYKIGWTGRDLENRIGELRTGNPKIRLYRAYEGPKQVETILHNSFDDKRVLTSGVAGQEWFELNSDDLKWIDFVLRQSQKA